MIQPMNEQLGSRYPWFVSQNLKNDNGGKLTLASHQPDFFPWMGYFYKIFQSDIFV